jgi:DNA-directed RNA polymerase specialized sigma24 family protein
LNQLAEELQTKITDAQGRISAIDDEKRALKVELRYWQRDLTEALKPEIPVNQTIEANNKLREENAQLRELIVLTNREQGISYTKIAQFMGVKIETIRQRFKKATRQINRANDGFTTP